MSLSGKQNHRTSGKRRKRMMYTYSNKHGKQIRIENGTSDAKVIAALGADLGDAVFCDHAGYRTVYEVGRNRYRRERVLELVAKDKFSLAGI